MLFYIATFSFLLALAVGQQPKAACPTGTHAIGQCLTTTLCPAKATCVDGQCCLAGAHKGHKKRTCHHHERPAGSCATGASACPTGAHCRNEVCCVHAAKGKQCPNNAKSAGSCVGRLCGQGFACRNGVCCQNAQPKSSTIAASTDAGVISSTPSANAS